MEYIADRGYTDIKLNKHIDQGANLEEEYKKEGVKLTEDRIKYLVEERKIYKVIKTKSSTKANKKNITKNDEK